MTADFKRAISTGEIYRSSRRRDPPRLIVFVHGWARAASDHVRLFELLRDDEDCGDCDLLAFRYDAAWYTNTNPEQIGRALADDLNRYARENNYESIFLIGHSMGGLIARTAILAAKRDNHSWLQSVARLVLLASTNRGFIPTRVWQRIALRLASWLRVGGFIRSGMRRSPYVISIRLGWLTEFSEEHLPPEAIQVLGDDRFVAEDDSADVFRFENSGTLHVPNATHAGIGRIGSAEDLARLKDAMTRPISALAPAKPVGGPGNVVFLVHGIRDYGEWMEDLDEKIKREDSKAIVVKYRYGYFNILNFLFPFLRKQKINGFIDLYIQQIAKRPGADVSVVAHSNGTYVVAHALERFPSVSLKRVLLAGSVLPQAFAWRRLVGDGKQVASLRNDCASGDWPVGFLCGALRWIPRSGVGIGGFRGFNADVPGHMHQTRFVAGGHGAALEPWNHASIAQFLIHGAPTHAPPANTTDEVCSRLGFCSQFAPLLLLVAIVLVGGLGYVIQFLPSDLAQMIAYSLYGLAIIALLVMF